MKVKSLDPAMECDSQFDDMTVVDVPVINEGEVYAFDFDGVLSSGLDDAVYRMPTESADEALISQVATRFGINCAGMDVRYQRHLVHQGALWALNEPIEPGPALESARVASRMAAPVFVISARSGWFAVERMRRFLEIHGILPLEVYNVGRVTKVKQIQLLSREFPDKKINFVEDSIAHLEHVAKAGLTNVKLTLVRSKTSLPDELGLRMHLLHTIRTAMSIWSDRRGRQ
jgi:hypothetical protein